MDETATNYADLQQARLDSARQARNADQTAASAASAKTAAHKISALNAVLLILVALGIDGVQIFLDLIIIGVVLNWIIDIFAWLTFYVWLKALGISMSEARGMRILLSLGAGGLLEVISFGSLPAWTAFALLTVIFEYVNKK